MKDSVFTIIENKKIADNIYRMILKGDTSPIVSPGQFVNIKLPGLYLRRPISVCDKNKNELTLIYKTVGKGTDMMSGMKSGDELTVLTGLGNGYDTSISGDRPLLLGGGVGVPPLYLLCKELIAQGKEVTAALGFNTAKEVFLADEFEKLGCRVIVVTADGSEGEKGFVTDHLPYGYTHFYCCGPLPMLKAVYDKTVTDGQFSFEERMGCGFGACMGCSVMTKNGAKRVCKDGPVLRKDEIIWTD